MNGYNMTDIVPNWCRLGYFIDARDSMNDWCVAKVTEICEIKKTVTVFHDGWGTKTMTYPFKSSKIAPFRKNTLKYTGPKRCAVRDWTITESELAEMQGQLDQILASGLQGGDAFEITQFYRGRLYIFVENLLTCSYKIYKSYLVPVVKFFGSVIQLIVAWLKKAPELFPYYYKSFSSPDLYLEDGNVALALVWPELMDTLNKLFALENRVAEFFQTYDEVPADYKPSELTVMSDKKYSETLLYLINLFTKESGFEAVIAILSETDELKRVPFPFIATTLLYVLGQFIVPDFWKKFNEEMTAAVYQRIEIISELELKDLKHEDIIRVLGMIRDNSENLDLKKINFFLRMIRSNYFEKRIKGLSEINTLIDNLDIKQESVKTKISREGLRDWILSNNAIGLVVTDRPHVELIKRCSTLYKFLALCRALDTSHLETLWNSMQGKHESYVRATYIALMEFVPCLSEELNDYLYCKIKAVPLENYDESFLTMVKDFTAAALTQSIRYALQNRREYNKIFGLEIFEQLMLDSSPVDFCKLSCKYIGVIFTNPLTRKLLDAYVKKIIELIVNNESVPQGLKLLRKLIKGMKDPKRVTSEIKSLSDNYRLVDLVLDNLKLYLGRVREAGEAGEVDPWDKVVFGRFTHEDNIRIRLLFIEFLMIYSNTYVRLSEDQIRGLWEVLGEQGTPQEKNMFYEWLTKGIKRKPLLDDDNVSFIFTYIIMNDEKFPVSNNTEESFACFKWIFLNYHFNEENIDLSNYKLKSRNAASLIGFEKLVLIQLYSEKVTDEAAKLIISLLLRYSLQAISSAPQIQEEFTDSLLSIILQHKENEFIVTRGLNLFKLLLGDSENQEFIANTFVYVNESMTRDFQKIFYDQHRTIRHLRKEVSKFYKRPLDCTILQCGDKKYSGIDDDLELSLVKSHCITVEFKQVDYKEHNPLPGLSLNQKVIKTLFELLSNHEKSYTSVAWSLLVSLPTNQQLEEAFGALEENIEVLLDQTSIHKLLYELMIIRKLAEDTQWAQRFIEARGLEHLLEIFYSESGTHAAMRQESLLKTIANFLDQHIEVKSLMQFTSVFFNSLLTIVQSSTEIKEVEALKTAIDKVIAFITEENDEILQTFILENQQVVHEFFVEVLLGKLRPGLTASIELQLERISGAVEVAQVFFRLLFSMRQQAFVQSNEYYWRLLAYIVKLLEDSAEDQSTLVCELVDYVRRAPYAKSSTDKNEALCGVLSVLAKAWTPQIAVCEDHVSLFLTKCLFEIPESLDRNALVPPICKHPETRRCAFEVVLELCRISPLFLELTIRELDKFHEEPDWRGMRRTEWAISAVSKEKSQAGLVGLKNLGCTCYMNSLLQQLFMLNTFREGILATNTDANQENLLYQLQYLFASLQCSDKQYINTKAFASTIKDFDGNPINLNEQMDVDEFFNYFLDKLEGFLKDTPYQTLIKQHFGGLQVTELIGKDCTHRSERYEPFLSISVEVKNKKSLQEGLESFVAGEMLEGENAYQCDHCEAKVRALRRVCIKHLPNFLIIALRRFEFDFDSMTRVKLNDFCEFPLDIDMEPYTQEGLDRQEKEKERLNNKDVQVPPKKFHDDYYNYKLRGIVIHAGTAETGHYYSYIRDALQHWYEFNDIWIKEFNPEDMPDECFGGEEKFSWSSTFSSSPNTGVREKFGNAYLLFYERTGVYQVRNPDDEVLENTSLAVRSTGELSHLTTIRKQNQKYWRNKHIFAYEYSNFVYSLSKIESMPFKFVMKFTLTILLRTREKKEEFVYMYMRLEKEIKNNPEYAKWILDLIGVSSVCKELLLYCPVINMRKIVVGFVKSALNSAPESCFEEFMLKILCLLPFAKKQYTRNYAQYLEVLKLSILVCQDCMEKHKVLKNIVFYLLNKPFKLPERPEDTESDIYLGYDHFTTNDNEKIDTFFSDSKGTSYGHVYHLLFLVSNQIPEKVITMLKEPYYIEELLRNVDNKLTIRYFGSLYAELMCVNQESAMTYTKKLLDFFQASDIFIRARCYKIFTPFLLKKCLLQSEIVDVFLRYKHKQMRNSKNLIDVELFLSYIFNLCAKSKDFQGFLRQQAELIQWAEKWIKDNMHYGFATASLSRFEENVKPALKALYVKCQKLIKNEELFNANYWDSGEEIEEEKLQRNMNIDTVDGQHWVKGVIIERIGDLLYLHFRNWDNSESSTLKEAHGDEIAPAGHYTSKSNMHS